VEVGGIGSGSGSDQLETVGGVRGMTAIKQRNGSSFKGAEVVDYVNEKDERQRDGKLNGVAHYDADVLTKVIVYVGIAVLAMEFIPVLFNLIGWGVHSSPPSLQ
jgi:hypothetical protein